MVGRQRNPLLTTPSAESGALFITQWIRWQSENNRIAKGNFKVDEISY
jgi:hypothetical protein